MTVLPPVNRWMVTLVLTLAVTAAGAAQERKSAGTRSAPLASADPSGAWVRARESRVAPLRRAVSLRLNRASLRSALDSIGRSAGLSVIYGEDVLRSTVQVTLRVDGLPLLDALTTVLDGTGLDAFVSVRGDALLVRPAPALVHRPTGSVVGRVTDVKTGSSVAGAEVLLEGTRWRTASDTGGRYRLTAVDAGSYTLVVRRFGYARQSRAVTVAEAREDTANVALEPVPTKLDELVTTATGQRRRLEIANAVTTLRADSIVRTQPIKDVTDLLETRVPGLTTLATTGAPGDPTRLRLRGSSSILRSNDPIVIVDGVRIYAEQSAPRSASLAWGFSPLTQSPDGDKFAVAAPSPLDRVDPNSIETIEVLNGASAATLYGADAANGVIVITTKRGRPGPARWDVGLTHGRSVMPGSFPDTYFGFWRALNNDNANCALPLAGRDLTCALDSVVPYQVLNDPKMTVLGQGRRSSLSATVSGGRPDIRYAITGSYADEVGLLTLPQYEADHYREVFGRAPEAWMERPHQLTKWSLSSKFTFRPASTAEVTLTAGLAGDEQRRSTLEQQLAALRGTYVDKANDVIYREDTPGQGNWKSRPSLVPDFYRKTTNRALGLKTGANLTWHPFARFMARADAGVSADFRHDESLLPPRLRVGILDSTGFHATGQGTTTVGTLNVGASYDVPLRWGFTLDAAIGFNYTSQAVADLARQVQDVISGIFEGGKSSASSDNITSYGWYVAPRLGNQRLFFDLGFRLDGGSNYGASASGFKLPKLGFSWLVSDEPFFPLKDSRFLSTLRLRASYGQAGVQPGPTDRLRLLSRENLGLDDQTVQVARLTTLGNTQLRPERSSEIEGGFDADLFADRLSVGLTAYRETKNDALLNVPLPPSVHGGSRIRINIGVVRNTGYELTLSTNLLRNELVSWSTQLQVSHNRNVVVSLANGLQEFSAEDGRIVPGYPLFGRWEPPIRGYADANGDGILQSAEVLVGDSLVYLGAQEPPTTASLHTTLGLFRSMLTLSAGAAYQDGTAQRQSAVMGGPLARASTDPSAPQEHQALLVAASRGGGGDGVLAKSEYGLIQTVSALQFQSLAVNWRLPQALMRWIGAQEGSVAVQGTNLGLFTNYRGKDPLVSSLATGNGVLDAGALPQPREWRVAVNFSY